MRYDLSIDVFLDRLRDMPDIEAVQEIDLRLQRIVEDRSELRSQPIEQKRETLEGFNQDEARLRMERHLIVMRLDRLKWSKAVRAIWGDEGLQQCLEWFEVMREPKFDQLPLQPGGRR